MYCRSCKYWHKIPEMEEMYCDFINTISGESAVNMGRGADIYYEALDDSGLSIWLQTGPMFGCVNFVDVNGGEL